MLGLETLLFLGCILDYFDSYVVHSAHNIHACRRQLIPPTPASRLSMHELEVTDTCLLGLRLWPSGLNFQQISRILHC